MLVCATSSNFIITSYEININIIEYVLSKYGNTQAALSIMDDAEETKHRLSHVAGGLKLCEDLWQGFHHRDCVLKSAHCYLLLSNLNDLSQINVGMRMSGNGGGTCRNQSKIWIMR